jgi:superfamily II DNA or RNA helicase
MSGSNDLQRLFNSKQRQELYIESGAKCQLCGDVLERGWHADHVVPFSKGGPTTLDNGQALCRKCNLAKGDANPILLREWQIEALAEFAKGQNNFLAVACPAAGKTKFALEVARREHSLGRVQRIVIVVPREHLKRQWAVEAANFGLQIDNEHDNATAAIGKDFHGVAVTYAQVAANPRIHKTNTQMKTLVIFDEIHHANDGESEEVGWGVGIQAAYGHDSCRRLLLSGTPLRTDGRPIPFVDYEDGKPVAQYSYTYGQALRDGIVRPIDFTGLSGDVGWQREFKQERVNLKEASDDDTGRALASALNSKGAWIDRVMREADDALSFAREEMRDAAGLVLASDKEHAYAYAKLLRSICGEDPTVVLHDIPDSGKAIEQFAQDTKRWIVAVQMVSEGVDIPRLAVGVYATRIRTELFFRQAVGRFVRKRDQNDLLYARIFYPEINQLVEYAQKIEQEIDGALSEKVPPKGPGPGPGPTLYDQTVILPSFTAEIGDTIRSGVKYGAEEVARAQKVLAQNGHTTMSPVEFINLAREFQAQTPASMTPTMKAPLKRDEMDYLKEVSGRLVAGLATRIGEDHKEINRRLKMEFKGLGIGELTLAQLRQRNRILQEWLANAPRR